jgi:hypothetical protein
LEHLQLIHETLDDLIICLIFDSLPAKTGFPTDSYPIRTFNFQNPLATPTQPKVMFRYLRRVFGRRYVFLLGILILLLMAFAQGYKTTHDLHWAYDMDFDRDMSFIQGNLDGHFGKDPNYLHEYLWYSPLLFSIESLIVRMTGLPANVVVTQAGVYLNALAPVAFLLMSLVLFGFEIALASLLSFLFLASGNILGWGAATYSPWLYPVCFVQFLFYLNIIFLYKALLTQRYIWFLLLGIFAGITFLGHVAPAIIIILMISTIQAQNLFKAWFEKNRVGIQRYFIQSAVLAVPFLVTASPILFVILGRYKMHYLHRAPFEFVFGIFSVKSYMELIKANVNIVFVISVAGLYWFYKNFQYRLIRIIIFRWLVVCIFMYVYSTITPIVSNRIHINLPVTVPSFHYFFYLKVLESIFFGFGLCWMLRPLVRWLSKRIGYLARIKNPERFGHVILVLLILFIAIGYYPVYKSREDFVYLRKMAIQKEGDKDKLEVYNYIKGHIPSEKVILCELGQSMFPVMASGRKMVSTVFTFSNPFVDYEEREKDRNTMLAYLTTGLPVSDKKLFNKYQVSYILLSISQADKMKTDLGLRSELIFRNKSYILLAVAGQNQPTI